MFKILGLLSFVFLFSVSCTKNTAEKDGEKVLYISTPAKVKGFDPNEASDLYSGNEVARVYEGLLQFHYLKRPYTLVPNLAEAMPTVSTDGLTYTFKLKKGVLFHDDECFLEGKGRELKASDFVYSIKRMADPKLQSKGWWLIDGKIAGLNEWRDKNAEAATVNYGEEVAGLKAVDSHTVQFKLTKPFPQFLYALAMPFTYAVAKEAVEKYGAEFLNHPIGTGPFTTKKYTQGNKITYTKNPKYRDEYYPSEGEAGDEAKGLLADKGKKIPLVDKVVVSVITEEQTRWLNFLKGKLDTMTIPAEQFNQVIVPGQGLAEDFTKKGIRAEKKVGLDVTYNAFNHEHPLFKDNVKLRQAMSTAFDREKVNKNFYYGISVSAQSIVPPNIAGYIEGFEGPYQNLNVEKAKKLLAEAGYPGGKGLPEITLHYKYDTKRRQMTEMFQQMMSQIGIKVKPVGVTWPELLKLVNTKQTMMFGMAWGADYPDAENFLQLLYSGNKAPGSNASNFDDPNFDKMFEKASVMGDSPERTSLYEKMYKYASEKVPLIFGFHRVGYGLLHNWLKNYKFTEFNHGISKYFDVDPKVKAKTSEKL